MNWLRQLDGVPLDALDARHAGDVDRVSSWCRPWPNSWKIVITSSCVNVRGLAVHRRRQVAGEVGDRQLDVRAGAAAVDRVVHPRAALLALARVVVEVELADQRARAVDDLEEAHVACHVGGLRLADRDAVDRLDDAEQPGQHAVLREVPAHLLVRERVALRLELLRRVREIPRRELGESELVAGERRELREVALGERLRAAREVAQEGEHLVGVARHLRHQRDLGEVGVAEQPRRLVAQREHALDQRACCPTRDRRRAPTRASRRRGAASARSARSSAYCITGR